MMLHEAIRNDFSYKFEVLGGIAPCNMACSGSCFVSQWRSEAGCTKICLVNITFNSIDQF